MIPIDQTIFPSDTEPMRGNCFATCLASILELPVDEVPHVMMHGDWLERTNQWLTPKGLGLTLVKINTEEMYIYPLPPGMLVILGGHTSRHLKRLHAVVGMTMPGGVTWEFVHDPHPDRSFLTQVTDMAWVSLLDPAIKRN